MQRRQRHFREVLEKQALSKSWQSLTLRGAIKIDFRKKLGIWPNKGLTEAQDLLKFSKTKFALVNGQKCDETHKT